MSEPTEPPGQRRGADGGVAPAGGEGHVSASANGEGRVSAPAGGEGRVSALQAAILEACFAPDDAAKKDLPGLLARHSVAAADRDALLAAPRRLSLYRKLVRGNVTSVAEAILERGYAHLERAAKGAWDAGVDAYLAGGGPRTAHLRDVPGELCAVLLPRIMQDARVPPYVAELFRLDLAEFTLGAHADVLVPASVTDVDASRPVLLRGPFERLRVAYPVHELTSASTSHVGPRDSRLFLYRTAEHDVSIVVLSPFADELLARLVDGATLGVAIGEAAAALDVPVSEPLLTEVARWLADFGERGVLLGAPE